MNTIDLNKCLAFYELRDRIVRRLQLDRLNAVKDRRAVVALQIKELLKEIELIESKPANKESNA
jgi:hypothetical protein